MPLYDVAEGELLETDDDRLLDEDELAEAREKRAGGKSLEAIAKGLGKGVRVYEPPADPGARHVAVDVAALIEHVGLEAAAAIAGLPAAALDPAA